MDRRRSAGFSLIEVMAVVALISLVFFVALNFYTDLSRASARATEHTQDIRRAAAIMDRVARDFEGAMLVVKPPEMDPIEHPWLFVAESQLSDSGADHVKFITRNHDPTRTANPESDLAVVAYTTQRDEDGTLSLHRWSTPRMPEDLDRDFPRTDEDGSHLVAEGLSTFGMQFVGEDGEVADSWDSTTLERSSTLPSAVEIYVAIASADFDPDFDPDTEAVAYQRRAIIAVRPLDFRVLLDPNANAPGTQAETSEDDDDATGGGGQTVADCVNIGGADPSDQVAAMWISLFPSIAATDWDPALFATMPQQIQALVDPSCR